MNDSLDRLASALSDRYRIESELGAGGMATVYLAEDLKHHRKVAVKVLRPELAAILGAERFLKEIEVTASLQHPHILPLHDSGEADSFLYYVMPYVEGESLRDKLNRDKQLGVDETVKIAEGVAAALDYAHRQGVIHRDIKPENILIHDGQPVVADFGIALAVTTAGGTRLTETGLSLGTPEYMSPEQATGERKVTAKSDVYSLGAVVYEMLVGEPPHTGSTVQAIIAKVVSVEPEPISTVRHAVPGNVEAAVQKALAKVPADRFARATEFAEALANPAFTLPTTHGAVAGVPASGAWKLVNIGVAVFAAAMTLTALWGWLRPIPKPVSRYSVALPEEEALADGGARIAVSSDGSRLVYMGRGEPSHLLLRNRDQLYATPLPDTDGASAPFFSPDGSRVGFYDGNEDVWRVASLGSAPITIADSGIAGGGGSWGADGYLYFDGNLPGNGLVRVAESGGPPEAVTMIDSTRGEEEHRWPEALPGGRGVVFSVQRGGIANLAQWDIAVADLTAGAHTVLLRGVRAVYAASGHLIYVTADGTLMAVPFDQTTLTLTGDAVALAEGLRVGIAGFVDIAVSGTGTLFYTTGGVPGGGVAEMVWVTRNGGVEVIDPGWTGDFVWPDLSPDGTQLAVSIFANSEVHVWIKRLDRGPLPKHTFAGTFNKDPDWTPDGRSVAFVSDRGNNWDLYARQIDGTGQAQLLRDEDRPIEAVMYSPDGAWLVYGVTAESRDLYALKIGADSAPVTLVATEHEETAPAVSPDGRWLAYASNASGRFEVYVLPFPNTNDRKWQMSTDGGTEPVWGHSGTELFYKGGESLMSVAVHTGSTFVPGERRALFSIQGFRSSAFYQLYDVTPDDQRFVMIRNLGGQEAGELIVVENFFEELKAKVGNE